MSQDKNFPSDFKNIHVHFVGIKGTGMVALVEILFARGAIISGSDVSERFYTDDILDKLGIKALPFSESNITDEIDYVVYSSAYSPEKNPDLIAAARKNIPMFLYTQALGKVSSTAYSCGVCGVHGKTTTTGLVGTLLKGLDLKSQVLAGSIIASFGNSCTMTSSALAEQSEKTEKKSYFVAETCEYQRHFMSFEPKKIILTSVESDHQDYYPTYADIRDAFVDYVCKLPENGQLIYCADESGACEVAQIASKKRPDIELIPYGEKASGAYSLKFTRTEGGKQYFELGGIGECALKVPGKHNVRNACAAVALVTELLRTDGKDPSSYVSSIKQGLLNFAGGKRRSEIVGHEKSPSGQDVIFIDDYAHHPTAIKTTLAGFREFYGDYEIIVDFMSHTYTRTLALLEDFAGSFGSADKVIINKIYGSARENAGEINVSGEMLYEHAKKYHPCVSYAGEFDEASKLVLSYLSKPTDKKYPSGYVFVTMGAGDNWKVAKTVISALKSGEKHDS